MKIGKIILFLSGSFHQVYGVTGEDLISETAGWPIFFRINIITAVIGTHF